MTKKILSEILSGWFRLANGLGTAVKIINVYGQDLNFLSEILSD